MNKELVDTLLELIAGSAFIMLFIVAACLVTPKIAKFIEKKYPNLKENENENKTDNPEDYKVQGPYDSQKLEGWDPNYKIYNEDIYGVDFKHGKKQKRKDG